MEFHEVPLAELEDGTPRLRRSWGQRQSRWIAMGLTVLALGVVVAPGGSGGKGETAGGLPTGDPEGLQDPELTVLGTGEYRLVPMVAPQAPVNVRLGWNPRGTGFVDGSTLPELPEWRAYQLWALVGTDRVSVGVLGHRPGVVSFSAQIPEVRGFSLTEEPAKGSEFSLSTPLAYAGIAAPSR